jgi:hypothetical protein
VSDESEQTVTDLLGAIGEGGSALARHVLVVAERAQADLSQWEVLSDVSISAPHTTYGGDAQPLRVFGFVEIKIDDVPHVWSFTLTRIEGNRWQMTRAVELFGDEDVRTEMDAVTMDGSRDLARRLPDLVGELLAAETPSLSP